MRRIQLRVAVLSGDTHLRRDQHGIAVVAPIAFLHPANDLTLHATITAVVYCLPAPTCETSRNSPGHSESLLPEPLQKLSWRIALRTHPLSDVESRGFSNFLHSLAGFQPLHDPRRTQKAPGEIVCWNRGWCERTDLGLCFPGVVHGSCPDKIHGTVVQTLNRNSVPDLAVPNSQRCAENTKSGNLHSCFGTDLIPRSR